MKQYSITIFIIILVAVSTPSMMAQKKIKNIPPKKQTKHANVLSRGFGTMLEFSDSKNLRVGEKVQFGVHLDATYCVDMNLGESFMPPLPPPGGGDIRFVNPRGQDSCMDLGISNDFRPFTSIAQIDTYKVSLQPDTLGFPVTVRWTPLKKYYGGQVTLSDPFKGRIITVDMKKDTSATIKEEIPFIIIIAQKPFNPQKKK